jgi:hypothetical protein
MLDKLKPVFRHCLILVGMAVLTWAGTEFVPALQDQGGAAAAAAAVLSALLLYLTPLTRQYGLGSGG